MKKPDTFTRFFQPSSLKTDVAYLPFRKTMKDILEEITRLRIKRNWNEYELAKHSGLSQSTISTWYRKNQTPTIQTLDKVCKGFGITLSQFFAENDDAIYLTESQREILDNWTALNIEQQKALKALMNTMK